MTLEMSVNFLHALPWTLNCLARCYFRLRVNILPSRFSDLQGVLSPVVPGVFWVHRVIVAFLASSNARKNQEVTAFQ